MVRPPFSVRHSHAQIAAVPVASLASAFFPKRRSSECGQPKSPACKRVKFDFAALVFHVRLKFMVESSLKKITPPFDDGEDCRLERAGSFTQAVTTWDIQGLTGLKFVSPFVSHRQNSLVKYGGERGGFEPHSFARK